MWGLGQRPNCSTGDQFKEKSPQRRRQRSVPDSNFALPQERPPSCSFQHLCCVAPDGRDRIACLPDIACLSRKQGISPCNTAPWKKRVFWGHSTSAKRRRRKPSSPLEEAARGAAYTLLCANGKSPEVTQRLLAKMMTMEAKYPKESNRACADSWTKLVDFFQTNMVRRCLLCQRNCAARFRAGFWHF